MPFWWQFVMRWDSSGKRWVKITDEEGQFIVEAENGPKAERKIYDEEFRQKSRFWRKHFKFCSLGVHGPYNTREEAINSFFVELARRTKNPDR